MNQIKRLLAVLMALCVLLCFCACTVENKDNSDDNLPDSGSNTGDNKTNGDNSGDNTPPEDDDKIAYTVKVVDEGNHPIANLNLTVCAGEQCNVGVTDSDGTAVFKLAEGEYYASLLALPNGYEYTTEEEKFYFSEGSTELTITLRAVS